MGRWIDLKLHRVPSIRVHDEGGVTINIRVSPYDVPLAARGEYLASDHVFRIELQYMTINEPTERISEGPHTLTVGKRSGRIYRIELDVTHMGTGSVSMDLAAQAEVTSALGSRSTTSPNAMAVSSTLSSTPTLYRELATAR